MNGDPGEATAVKIVRDGESFDAEIGRPDSNAIFFLDPPTGLGRQTPTSVTLPIRVSTNTRKRLTEACLKSKDPVALVDRNSETQCLCAKERPASSSAFWNVDLVVDWAEFRHWALSEGYLEYEGYSHDWHRLSPG